MINTRLKGRSGEEIAAEYLKKHGYEILDKNFTTEIGEIDIVAAHGGYIVFVEVKARLNDKYGFAADSVDYHKRKKINQVASQYIKKFRLFDCAVRFDVIEVYTEDRRVEHIINAFDSYLRY
jgi:TIGR00252 family protein